MSNPTLLFSGLLSALIILGLPCDFSIAASIEDVLTSLKGLSAKERLTRVESEARKEGSVRWASSTPQPWAEPALQLFRKRYPTIQVEYMRQSGRVLAERIIREHRAGKYDIDIVGTSAVTFAGMKDSGVIAPYVSPEAAQLRQNMKDPAGWWVAYFGNIQAIQLEDVFSPPCRRCFSPANSTFAGERGRPVKFVNTYSEELLACSPRHPAFIFLRVGVRKDGTFAAWEGKTIYNGGAYGAFKPKGSMTGALKAAGSYAIPHTRIQGYCVYTNQVPCGYFRAPGEAQTLFAVESHVDFIADKLGTRSTGDSPAQCSARRGY